MFKKIFVNLNDISNVLELGCNRGNNLEAIHLINQEIVLNGIDINSTAIKILNNKNICLNAEVGSIYDVSKNNKYDMVFTKGVLIHINPINLEKTYNKLFSWSKKYILLAEYYNPTPMTVEYRGYSEKLFKRDFAGEMIDKFPSLEIVNYGFSYHRANFPQDDITWFLLEKRNL